MRVNSLSKTESMKRNLFTEADQFNDEPVLSKSVEKSKAIRYAVYKPV